MSDLTLKERFINEINKIKSLKGAERREYIWEYYKIHFFVFLIILFFVYMLLDAMVFNPSKSTFLGIALYGPYVGPEICIELQDRFNDIMLTEEMQESLSVHVTNFHLDPSAGAMSRAVYEKFAAMAGAREIDIIITDMDFLNVFAMNGSLLDLSFLEGLNFPLSDMYYSAVYTDIDRQITTDDEYPLAIPLTGSSILDAEYYTTDGLYLCVMVGTLRPYEVTDAVNLITNP